jgi:hypothetical protein
MDVEGTSEVELIDVAGADFLKDGVDAECVVALGAVEEALESGWWLPSDSAGRRGKAGARRIGALRCGRKTAQGRFSVEEFAGVVIEERRSVVDAEPGEGLC